MAFVCRSAFHVFFIVVMFATFNAVANDDDYLKLLEGEAEDVKLDQSGQLKNKEKVKRDSTDGLTKTNWKWEGNLEGDLIPSGLAQDEFATLLKQNFYGTFVFYRKLNSVDQNTVYYQYKKASPAKLDSIRQDILSHLKK